MSPRSAKLVNAKLDELRRTQALLQQDKPEEALAIVNTGGKPAVDQRHPRRKLN